MATIYLDRIAISATNGVFTFEDGDLQSARVDIGEGARRFQGMGLDHTTSGFTVPNFEPTLTFSYFIRKTQAFIDYLKSVDWSQAVSIVGMGATSGSGMELGLITKITLINVIAASEDFNFSGIGNAGTSNAVFYAQDYLVEQQ